MNIILIKYYKNTVMWTLFCSEGLFFPLFQAWSKLNENKGLGKTALPLKFEPFVSHNYVLPFFVK